MILAATALLVAVGFAATTSAEPVLLEGIVAQVGDEIILESELREQIAVARLRFGIPDSALVRARDEILERLIDEKVIIQEARKQGITITEEEVGLAVEQLIDNLRQQMGTEAAFERALDEEGLTFDELRERYRDQARNELLYTRLIQREIYSKIEITEEDVEDFYREHRDELPKKQETVRLSHVFVGIRPSDQSIAQAQTKLNEVRDRLDAGQEFASIARELSDDPGSREDGGDLGWFERGDLDPTFEEVVFGLEVGEVSEPFQTPIGIELVRVTDKDEARGRVRAQHILVLLRPGPEDKERARETAEKVHRLAETGTSFEVLADTYSDDRDSAEQGGDLGDFAVKDLVPFVAEAVKGLGVGDISDVVETDQGFHVFKVTKREAEGEYGLSEISGELRQMIGDERAAELTESYLDDIRGNYYIRRTDEQVSVQPETSPTPGVKLDARPKWGTTDGGDGP